MIATANDLVFDAEQHKYWIGGREIPSVTQILDDLAIADYSRLPPTVRDESLLRGAQVHEALHYYFEGDLDESSLPEEYRGYFQAAMAWCAEVGLSGQEIELKGYVAVPEYCGRLDLEGDLMVPRVGRRRCLVDWKTGVCMPWVRLQTAAYARFFANPATRYRVSVELHKDGTFATRWMPPNTFLADWQGWVAAVTTYYNKRSLKW